MLWALVSGKRVLPYWYWSDKDHNLEVMFPDDPDMRIVNELLSRTVVEREPACLSTAKEFLREVDVALTMLKSGGQVLRDDIPRPCRVCGVGRYTFAWGGDLRLLAVLPKEDSRTQMIDIAHMLERQDNSLTVRLARCSRCGHIEMFNFPEGERPEAWATGNSAQPS